VPEVSISTAEAASTSDPWTRLRPFPGVRAIRIALRTAHIAAFATLYGGHWHGLEPERLRPALVATLVTGAVLVALEVYRTPAWPVQLRGLAALVKIVIVAIVASTGQARMALLTAALVIGAVSSHMPGRFRYYSLIHRRMVGDTERG
jgi:hypothetical protein